MKKIRSRLVTLLSTTSILTCFGLGSNVLRKDILEAMVDIFLIFDYFW